MNEILIFGALLQMVCSILYIIEFLKKYYK